MGITWEIYGKSMEHLFLWKVNGNPIQIIVLVWVYGNVAGIV
jgi:hypothetical protein